MKTKNHRSHLHTGTKKNYVQKLKKLYPECKYDYPNVLYFNHKTYGEI
jgi:hypothetical protein